MNLVNPNDVAKWFSSQKIIEKPNTREGNMKIQKLLFFAQLIYMEKTMAKQCLMKNLWLLKMG